MKPSAERRKVVIVGGGPVGMTVALGLARHGVSSLVVEQTPSTVRESRTLNVWARVLETFRVYELADSLLSHGEFIDTLEPLDAATDRALLSLDLSVLDAVSPYAGVLMIPQYAVEDVLREAVSATSLCATLAGRCIGIEQGVEFVAVTVETADGTTVIDAEYCIGADGAHSTVRKLIQVPLTGSTLAQRMVLSDELLDEGSRNPAGFIRFDIRRAGFNAALRFGKHRWRLMSSIPPGSSDEQAMSAEAVTERVERLFGSHRHHTEWISAFSIHRRVADRYRVGRVFLAGDAAHLVSPVGGQGMNAGMLDAENLAWKLAAVLKGEAGEPLLESYHDERHTVMASTTAQNAMAATEAEFNQAPWKKLATIRVLGLALRIPRLRRAAARGLSMLNSAYPSSTVLHGTHRLIGHRLDDLVMASGERVFDVLNLAQGTAVILVGMQPPHDVALPGRTTVLEVEQLPRKWRVPNPGALVVRPDRHVAAVLANPTSHAIRGALDIALGREPLRTP